MQELEKKVIENSTDIAIIKNDINTIKTNHLAHLEADMRDVKETMQSMDKKLWAVLLALVIATVFATLGDKLGF